MMRQHQAMKRRHPDAILFFQMGDFYETFHEDAVTAARELDIALTARDGIPMAGVPVRKAELYVQRLLRRGHKVAMCPQVERPGKGKKLLRRSVVRVLTPGTVLEEEALHPDQDTLLAAVFPEGARLGVAWVDAASGRFEAEEVGDDRLSDLVTRLAAQEWILPEHWTPPEQLGGTLTRRHDQLFNPQALRDRFPEALLNSSAAASAAAAIIGYLEETVGALPHLRPPSLRDEDEHMLLDTFTQRSLELTAPLRAEGQHTVLSVLDRTTTPMGRRLLRRRLLGPLRDPRGIALRLDAVEALLAEPHHVAFTQELRRSCDLVRLVGRAGLDRLLPPDLNAVQRTLNATEALSQQLRGLPDCPEVLVGLLGRLEAAPRELPAKIAQAVVDEPPRELGTAPVIRRGYDDTLDAALARADELRQRIADLESAERSRTKIGNLRVGFNKVMGYYFEVSRTQLPKVPDDWRRRQTLTNGERFTSSTLEELADGLLEAQTAARSREQTIVEELYASVRASSAPLSDVGDALAELDVYLSSAILAQERNYKRPSLSTDGQIKIVDGRHPVVETTTDFVPNDLILDASQRLVVITGPNMAGKSVYLRQVALMALLAQIGSFVPAKEAVLPVFDRVYTRVGASDAVADGLSTFMAEMHEAASIVSEATERSLVILDELGRGTSTHDGMSLAWSIARFLVRRVRCMTLFATHYRELAALAEEIPGVVNLRAAAREWEGKVVFLHRLQPGVAERSYGIHVARLAELPEEILREAQRLLARLEHGGTPVAPVGVELSLFGSAEHPVLARLRALDPDRLTPIEALQMISELRRMAEE